MSFLTNYITGTGRSERACSGMRILRLLLAPPVARGTVGIVSAESNAGSRRAEDLSAASILSSFRTGRRAAPNQDEMKRAKVSSSGNARIFS